jgi:hypothetical protein
MAPHYIFTFWMAPHYIFTFWMAPHYTFTFWIALHYNVSNNLWNNCGFIKWRIWHFNCDLTFHSITHLASYIA